MVSRYMHTVSFLTLSLSLNIFLLAVLYNNIYACHADESFQFLKLPTDIRNEIIIKVIELCSNKQEIFNNLNALHLTCKPIHNLIENMNQMRVRRICYAVQKNCGLNHLSSAILLRNTAAANHIASLLMTTNSNLIEKKNQLKKELDDRFIAICKRPTSNTCNAYRIKLMKFLVQAGANIPSNVIFVMYNHKNNELLKTILDLGVDPNCLNSLGKTILMEACLKEDLNLVRLIKKHARNLDVNYRGREHTTALMCAASIGNLHIVYELLQIPNINTTMCAQNRLTAYQIAENAGHMAAAELIKNNTMEISNKECLVI